MSFLTAEKKGPRCPLPRGGGGSDLSGQCPFKNVRQTKNRYRKILALAFRTINTGIAEIRNLTGLLSPNKSIGFLLRLVGKQKRKVSKVLTSM